MLWSDAACHTDTLSCLSPALGLSQPFRDSGEQDFERAAQTAVPDSLIEVMFRSP